ncbi:O-antigen ligase family protein [Vacuolonema iberomarrocanum]|uniref:O-antigen ligase family protein n=1 Tax=Vacuolonema iberomarrocanum TaxID=3454632 RepID=UPI0019E935E9|nr:O-antigen ligase family protein [filamentous cyanobacterium LEGE 07170]
MSLLVRDYWILVLVFVASISFIWSADVVVTNDLIKAMIRSTFLGLYVASRWDLKDQLTLWLWVFGLMGLLSVIVAVIEPSRGTHFINGSTALRGALPHKNEFSRVVALGFFTFFVAALDKTRRFRGLCWFSAISMLVMLVLARGATAQVSVLLLTPVLLTGLVIVNRRYKLKTALFTLALSLSAISTLLVVFNLEFIVTDILGRGMDLGRVEIWQLSIEKGLERPWLGYGYYGFWGSGEAVEIVRQTWARGSEATLNAHNVFVGIFLELGLVGVTLAGVSTFVVFKSLTQLVFRCREIEYFWMLILFLALIFFGMTVSGPFLSPNSIWTIYVSISYTCILKSRQLRIARSTPELSTREPVYPRFT